MLVVLILSIIFGLLIKFSLTNAQKQADFFQSKLDQELNRKSTKI